MFYNDIVKDFGEEIFMGLFSEESKINFYDKLTYLLGNIDFETKKFNFVRYEGRFDFLNDLKRVKKIIEEHSGLEPWMFTNAKNKEEIIERIDHILNIINEFKSNKIDEYDASEKIFNYIYNFLPENEKKFFDEEENKDKALKSCITYLSQGVLEEDLEILKKSILDDKAFINIPFLLWNSKHGKYFKSIIYTFHRTYAKERPFSTVICLSALNNLNVFTEFPIKYEIEIDFKEYANKLFITPVVFESEWDYYGTLDFKYIKRISIREEFIKGYTFPKELEEFIEKYKIKERKGWVIPVYDKDNAVISYYGMKLIDFLIGKMNK